MKCPNCGANGKGRFCEYCGTELEQEKPSEQPPQREVVHVYHETERVVHVIDRKDAYSDKSRGVALLLCVLLGWVGGHRFYARRYGTAVLYLLTFGLLGFGIGVDFFLILIGRFKDNRGRRLV